MMDTSIDILLDFDGTVVRHEYPKIGIDNPGAIDVIKRLQNKGHRIILNTYRADCNNETFAEAFFYLKQRGIHISDWRKTKSYPPKWDWNEIMVTKRMYIDDIAPNIPIRSGMVDWRELKEEFIKNKIL